MVCRQTIHLTEFFLAANKIGEVRSVTLSYRIQVVYKNKIENIA